MVAFARTYETQTEIKMVMLMSSEVGIHREKRLNDREQVNADIGTGIMLPVCKK